RRRYRHRSGQKPGRAPRSDAGTPGFYRWRHAPPGATLSRAGDAEPDRVRRHLSVTRGPARPIPDADRHRLPGTPRGVADAAAADRPTPRRGHPDAGGRPAQPEREGAVDV